MALKREPEQELALAVMQRVVEDLRHGTSSRKKRAIADVAGGGLDYWIEVVAESRDGVDVVRQELRKLACEAAGYRIRGGR